MSLQNESRGRSNGRKVRYAVVGAGWISQENFMPAVEHTGNSVLTPEALETGVPKPIARVERKVRPSRDQVIRLAPGYLGRPHRRSSSGRRLRQQTHRGSDFLINSPLPHDKAAFVKKGSRW